MNINELLNHLDGRGIDYINDRTVYAELEKIGLSVDTMILQGVKRSSMNEFLYQLDILAKKSREYQDLVNQHSMLKNMEAKYLLAGLIDEKKVEYEVQRGVLEQLWQINCIGEIRREE